MLPPASQALAHSSVRGAIRIAVRSGSAVGQSVRDVSRVPPTGARRGDVAVSQPRARTHIPVERRVQIAGGLEVFGDEGGVFVGEFRRALFDRGGQPPVQLGAVGLQLRFVGHGANQRMPEHIFDLSG